MDGFPRFDLQGRTALVTGAARGLGQAIARAMAGAGADVALGLRDPDSGAELSHEIEGMGRRCLRVAMDVRDLGQIGRAVEQVTTTFGRLDILVNNAGLGPANPAESVTEADYDLTMEVNVKGLFFASQAAGRAMIAQGFGRIVSLSSQAGFVALPTESVYCMSKAAVAHLTKCLAVEWGRYGLTVNAVAPTFIRTDGTAADLADATFEAEVIERIAGVHRIGEPMDVAGAVVFLASPAASLITGTTLLVDGGWTAR
ncbi:MAG TPA: glucose 1-dehydrogenase [Candidatus Limnocylindria bacterium]|nr:glucose 1-dehydrogenase [Candidatus Limnocylindria bacterium]